jgi:hypothetical protein
MSGEPTQSTTNAAGEDHSEEEGAHGLLKGKDDQTWKLGHSRTSTLKGTLARCGIYGKTPD